jgi:hypothetical protein
MLRIPMARGLGAALLSVVALTAGTARADIIFGSGNSPAIRNIGSYTQTGANTATGQFLGSPLVPVMDVLTDTDLTVPASGSARFAAASDSALFTTVVLTPVGPDWEIIELNPQVLRPQGDTGTFFLTAVDDNGDVFVSGNFNLGKGNNRVWAQAINGQTITSLTITASGALIADVRQVRILQAGERVIPEPSSIVLAGLGGLGLLGLARRRRTRV